MPKERESTKPLANGEQQDNVVVGPSVYSMIRQHVSQEVKNQKHVSACVCVRPPLGRWKPTATVCYTHGMTPDGSVDRDAADSDSLLSAKHTKIFLSDLVGTTFR